MRHEAWVTETLQSHVLFDAALRNVAAHFTPERKLTDSTPFHLAAGLPRERIGMRSQQAAADHLTHFGRLSATPYAYARDHADEFLYGRPPRAAPPPPDAAHDAAGRPSLSREHPACLCGKRADAPPYGAASVGAEHFGGATADGAPPFSTRELRMLRSPAGRGAVRPREVCPYHTDMPDEPEAYVARERGSRASARSRAAAEARDILSIDPNAEPEPRLTGVRVYSEHPVSSNSRASRKAAGSCHPAAVTTPPRAASYGDAEDRPPASTFSNTAEVAMRRTADRLRAELASGSHGYAGRLSSKINNTSELPTRTKPAFSSDPRDRLAAGVADGRAGAAPVLPEEQLFLGHGKGRVVATSAHHSGADPITYAYTPASPKRSAVSNTASCGRIHFDSSSPWTQGNMNVSELMPKEGSESSRAQGRGHGIPGGVLESPLLPSGKRHVPPPSATGGLELSHPMGETRKERHAPLSQSTRRAWAPTPAAADPALASARQEACASYHHNQMRASSSSIFADLQYPS